jgi:hypothetical protein
MAGGRPESDFFHRRLADRLRGFRQGLKDAGYVEGENVAIAYRFAENQLHRLPELAADLVRRKVALIATAGDDVALVAKAATTTTVAIASVPSANSVSRSRFRTFFSLNSSARIHGIAIEPVDGRRLPRSVQAPRPGRRVEVNSERGLGFGADIVDRRTLVCAVV